MATFGDRLKELREKKGKTQEDIAMLFGKEWKSMVSNWENNKRFPINQDVLLKLADYSECSVAPN